MDILKINKALLDKLWVEAALSPRLRMNYDLRNSAADTSQRMLNALQPDTEVPIHKHDNTDETVICLCGKLEEILYKKEITGSFTEVARYLLCPAEGMYGMQIPAKVWHGIRVIEPSVIFEAKDGAYNAK